MRKQLISFAKVVKFFIKYQAQGGGVNPNLSNPPLAYALGSFHFKLKAAQCYAGLQTIVTCS